MWSTMPKTTKAKMVRVSPETLQKLKEYAQEYGMQSLDSAISNAIDWARLWVCVDARTRRDMQSRISDLEFRVSALEAKSK